MVERAKFKSLEDIAERVAQVVLGDTVGGQWAEVQVKKRRALLRADAAEIVVVRQRRDRVLANGLAKTAATATTATTTVSAPNKVPFDVVPVNSEVDVVKIHKLRLVTIIGVNTIERLHKQNVILDLTLYKPQHTINSTTTANANAKPNTTAGGTFDKAYDFREAVQLVTDHVEDSAYKTVEAFVTSIAEIICSSGVEKVTVRAEKPSALTFADAAGVEVTRTRKWYLAELKAGRLSNGAVASLKDVNADVNADADVNATKNNDALFPDSGEFQKGQTHVAYIAFGSNAGPSLTYIQQCVPELASRGVTVTSTSSIFESSPMYVLSQAKFYNGVFKVETKLTPIDLLAVLKEVEYNVFGRVKELENGPRSIDLDIVLFDDDLVFNQPPLLTIPHVAMLDRSFVLKPLVQLVGPHAVHPLTAETFQSHLEQITDPDPAVQASSALRVVVPISRETFSASPSTPGSAALVYDPDHHTLPTQVMAILNATPDSFSDGGEYYDDIPKIVSKAREFVTQGATILDIGGMSTRPGLGADTIPSPQEEIKRVVPVIEALRKDSFFDGIVVSVDTYRASVARAAVAAGADIVNDISAGQLDGEMFGAVAELKVPIILNHTRGTPATMNSLADYRVQQVDDETTNDNHSQIQPNSREAVIEVVGQELEARVSEAVNAGIQRSQIILDPGLGFAKTLSHNMAIIQDFSLLRNRESLRGYAWLVGPSRKKFIGTITGQADPAARVLGTAAVVGALVQGGADIVRVHDVSEMVNVVKMADGIYRGLY